MTLQLNAANILGMTGQHRFLAIAMLASAALNLLLTVLLISVFGIYGAALGTLAAVLLVEAAVILPRACRHSQVSALGFIRTVVWPSLPAVLPMLACALVLDQWLTTDHFGLLCFKVATCGIVYLAGFYFTGLTAAERGLLSDKLLRGAPTVQLEAK